MSMKYACKECEAIFYNYYVLRRHVKKFHPDKLDVLAPLKTKNLSYKFMCSYCNKRFNYKHHMNFHLKTHGEVSEHSTKVERKCPLCEYKGTMKEEMYKHFKREHGFDIEEEQMMFSNIDEFLEWKFQFEKETRTKFIKARGTTPKRGYYICHRSGRYTPEGKGLRNLKAQGSNKINSFCPAQMKVFVASDDCVVLRIIKNHVGHKNELCHLNLTPTEREFIAEKIASNIPFSDILEQIRESASPQDVDRIHLLTKKDLHNITATYNLHSFAVKSGYSKQVQVDEGTVIDDSENNVVDESSVLNEDNATQKNECIQYNEEFVEEVEPTEYQPTLGTELAKYKLEVLELLKSISTFDELQACKNITDCINPTLAALRAGPAQEYEIVQDSDDVVSTNEGLLHIPKTLNVIRKGKDGEEDTIALISYGFAEVNNEV